MPSIRIFGQPDCIWCNRARALCETRSFAHTYTDLSQNALERRQIAERLGREDFTVPQIFVGDRLIGGFTQLALADHDGSLAQLIAGE